MRSWVLIVALFAALVCQSACENPPLPPEVTRGELNQSTSELTNERIKDLIEDKSRLLDVEYALTTGSATRCGALRPQAGVLLGRANAFDDDALRETAIREYGLGKHLSVVHVVPDGSFDLAGVQIGDQLLEGDKKSIGTADAFNRLMLETSTRESIQVLIQRGEEQYELTVPLTAGCPVSFVLSMDNKIIVFQGSKLRVIVPIAILRFIEDDNVLGLILAHQFAHVLFDDDRRSWPVQEADADRYGLLLAASAGFDVGGAMNYWETVASEYPWLIAETRYMTGPLWLGVDGYSHFGLGNRMAVIRATVQEIEARRASNDSSAIPGQSVE